MRTLITIALLSIFLQTVAPVGAQEDAACEGLLPSRLLDGDFSVSAGEWSVPMRATLGRANRAAGAAG
jgi:hypothetical protein